MLEYKGETALGTQIVDQTASAFDVNNVPMTETPSSTCFSRIGYATEYEILVVTFRDSGVTYLYLDVPQSEWEAFESSNSIGVYYNTNIKNNYDCNKWD